MEAAVVLVVVELVGRRIPGHSRIEARRASVLVTRDDAHVRAVVEDDGHGFDPTAHTTRLGVRGMRERVEILGGTLRIESAPGEGATVIVDVGLGP